MVKYYAYEYNRLRYLIKEGLKGGNLEELQVLCEEMEDEYYRIVNFFNDTVRLKKGEVEFLARIDDVKEIIDLSNAVIRLLSDETTEQEEIIN